MKKTAMMGILVILLAVVITTCTTVGTSPKPGFKTKTDAPLPELITIVKPGPEIAPELAAFSGAWFGRWDNQMDHILIVEQIESPEKVTALYSWGSGFGVDPGWVWTRGRFVGNKLQFQLQARTIAFVTYQVRGETLKADYRRNGVWSSATMKRVDLRDLASQ